MVQIGVKCIIQTSNFVSPDNRPRAPKNNHLERYKNHVECIRYKNELHLLWIRKTLEFFLN